MPADNTVFSVQCGFSFLVMMFCIGMLADDRDPTYYLPVLTSLIGYWLPAPRGSSTGSGLPGLPNLMMRRRATPKPTRAASTATEARAPDDQELDDMEAGSPRSDRPS